MKPTRTPWISTAYALALLSLASVALAQGPPGGGGGPPGGGFGGPPGGFGGFGGRGGPGGTNSSTSHYLTLAEDPAVWNEIKVTDEQLGKITRLKVLINKKVREVRNQTQTQFQVPRTDANGQPVPREERDAARQAERETREQRYEAIKKDSEVELKKILAKSIPLNQFTRVQQIDLQEAGPLVVARPDVSKELGLSPKQIKEIQGIIAGLTSERDKLNQSQRDFFNSMRNNGNNNNGGGNNTGGTNTGGNNTGGTNTGGTNTGGNNGGTRGGRGGNNAPQETDAEREARMAQFQQARDQMRTGTQTAKSKAIAAIKKVLTAAQLKKFDTMQGKTFDLALLNDGAGPNNPFDPGGGGGRGFGGPGGPPGGGPGGGGPGGGPGGGGPGGTTANAPATGAQPKAVTPTGSTSKTARPTTGR